MLAPETRRRRSSSDRITTKNSPENADRIWTTLGRVLSFTISNSEKTMKAQTASGSRLENTGSKIPRVITTSEERLPGGFFFAPPGAEGAGRLRPPGRDRGRPI